jgi:hypothetical protein
VNVRGVLAISELKISRVKGCRISGVEFEMLCPGMLNLGRCIPLHHDGRVGAKMTDE